MILIKKILKWSFWLVGVLLIGMVISTLLFKDRIIAEVVREFNKYIDTPIAVNKIDFNIWENFPTTSITFYDIDIKGSKPDADISLLEAEKVIITLNPLSLLRNEYEINSAIIRNARIFIDIDKNGRNNYSILKIRKDTSIDTVQLEWSLTKVTLLNTNIQIVDDTQGLQQDFDIAKNVLSINQDKEIQIYSNGDLFINDIKVGGSTLISEVGTVVNTKLIIADQLLTIEGSYLKVNSTSLNLAGTISLGEKRDIDIIIGSDDSNLKSLKGLIPINNRDLLKKYDFDGFSEFKVSIRGRISKSHSPSLKASYKIRDGFIAYHEKDLSLEQINTSGSLTIDKINDISSAELVFGDLKSLMNGEAINGSLSIKNLSDPLITANLSGTMQLEYLSPFIVNEHLTDLKGSVSGNIKAHGKLSDIRSGRSPISGDIVASSVIANHTFFKKPLQILKGSFSVNEGALISQNSSIKLGDNEIELDGKIQNIMNVISAKSKYDFTAKIKGGELDFDQLLKDINSSSSSESGFKVNKSINTQIEVSLGTAIYKNFEGRSLRSKIDIKNGRVVFRNLTFESGGGSLDLYGYIETDTKFEVNTRGKINGLYLDSLFYTFNNFNQDWLIEENLEGQITADILTVFELNEKMNLIPYSLTADVNASIKNGELNDFEPMISLGKYIRDDNLAHLKFSDIENNIHIENGIIYLPEMEVKSNVTTIQISGTHGFNKELDYRLVIPLNTLTRLRDDNEAFGAVEDDGSGSKLFLKITGTTSDYKIQYDKQAVKSKIVADLKGEVQELKEAFRKKEEEKTESIQLNEEEYFEWEVDTVGNIKY